MNELKKFYQKCGQIGSYAAIYTLKYDLNNGRSKTADTLSDSPTLRLIMLV